MTAKDEKPRKNGTSAPAPAPPEDPNQRLIMEAWRATLGTLNNAEEETHALIARLVGIGTLTREDGVRMFGELRALVEQRRNELETRVQTAIDSAMKRLTIPTPQDISEVAQKLAELERRVEALDDHESPRQRFQHPATHFEKAAPRRKKSR